MSLGPLWQPVTILPYLRLRFQPMHRAEKLLWLKHHHQYKTLTSWGNEDRDSRALTCSKIQLARKLKVSSLNIPAKTHSSTTSNTPSPSVFPLQFPTSCTTQPCQMDQGRIKHSNVSLSLPGILRDASPTSPLFPPSILSPLSNN